MADPFRPRFAKPSVLSTVEPVLLVRVLRPFADWLASQGIVLLRARDVTEETLKRLSLVLMAGTILPPGLVCPNS